MQQTSVLFSSHRPNISRPRPSKLSGEVRYRTELDCLTRTVPKVAKEIKSIIAQVEDMPLLDGEAILQRVIKAGFLIREGKVLPPLPFCRAGSYMNEVGRVVGSRPDPYVITYVEGQCHCDCEDLVFGRAPFLPSGQYACKHILAVLITEAVQSQLN